MRTAHLLCLIPLAIAIYSVLATTIMLQWASRKGRTTQAYKWGLVIYVVLFSLPTIVVVVPKTMALAGPSLQTAWAFFASACILGQIFPMFATHGYWAMWRHRSWGRIISLRAAAFHEKQMTAGSRPAASAPPVV